MLRRTAMITLIILMFVSFNSFAGTPTKKLIVTEKNETKLFEQVQDAKDISDEEKELFLGYCIEAVIIGRLTNQKKFSYYGKTVGEIIERGRVLANKQEEKEKKNAEEEKKEALAKQKEADKLLKQLSSYITFEVINKAYSPADFMKQQISAYNILSIIIFNNSTLEVIAFKGGIDIYDVFNDRVQRYNFKHDTPIKPNEHISRELYYESNPYDKEDETIRGTEFNKLKFVEYPYFIILPNGLTIGNSSDD